MSTIISPKHPVTIIDPNMFVGNESDTHVLGRYPASEIGLNRTRMLDLKCWNCGHRDNYIANATAAIIRCVECDMGITDFI